MQGFALYLHTQSQLILLILEWVSTLQHNNLPTRSKTLLKLLRSVPCRGNRDQSSSLTCLVLDIKKLLLPSGLTPRLLALSERWMANHFSWFCCQVPEPQPLEHKVIELGRLYLQTLPEDAFSFTFLISRLVNSFCLSSPRRTDTQKQKFACFVCS